MERPRASQPPLPLLLVPRVPRECRLARPPCHPQPRRSSTPHPLLPLCSSATHPATWTVVCEPVGCWLCCFEMAQTASLDRYGMGGGGGWWAVTACTPFFVWPRVHVG
jgi:hypothetical protein